MIAMSQDTKRFQASAEEIAGETNAKRLPGAIGCLALMLFMPGDSAAEAGAFSGYFIENVRPVGNKKSDGSYSTQWEHYNSQWQHYRDSNTCWSWTARV